MCKLLKPWNLDRIHIKRIVYQEVIMDATAADTPVRTTEEMLREESYG
jgi:hypothetical protein